MTHSFDASICCSSFSTLSVTDFGWVTEFRGAGPLQVRALQGRELPLKVCQMFANLEWLVLGGRTVSSSFKNFDFQVSVSTAELG